MIIAILNESTSCTDTQVDLICQAVQKQITLHCAPAWNQRTASVKFYPKGKKIPNYAWVVKLQDDSTVQGALGYHSEDSDTIDAFIFCKPVLDNGGQVLSSPNGLTVSSVVSHELLEMFLDRFANAYVDGPAIKQGSTYAMELCDPVESDSYEIDINGTKVMLSNFVFPAWFNPEANSTNMPFDYMKKLTKPFTMSAGGYMIIRKGGPGTETQVFGELIPEWKREMKRNNLSRFGRRTKK